MVTDQQNKSRVSDPFEEEEEGAKLERIADHTRGLVDDLTDWLELKLQYLLLDFQEQIKSRAKGFAYEGIAFVILGIALVFALIALALGVGEWLSHPAWGFLVVTGLLALLALVIRYMGKRAGSQKEVGQSLTYGAPESQKKLSGKNLPELSDKGHGKD